MAKKNNLSIEERAKVVVLVQEGYRMNEVARKIKLSRCCAQEVMKKQKETGTVVDRQRSGRPNQISGRPKATTVQQGLVRLSLRDRKATAPERKCMWAATSGVSTSIQTVRRCLLQKGLRGCVAAKKPQ